jgi:hypothetical protein
MPKEVKERQRTSTGGTTPQLMEIVPQAAKGTARKRAAKEFGDVRASGDASQKIWADCAALSDSQWIAILARLVLSTYRDALRL